MKNIVLLLLLVTAIVALAFLALPEDPGDAPPPAQVLEPDTEAAEEEARIAIIEAERDARLTAMRAEYEKLERARRLLRIRLRDISYYLHYAEFEPAQQNEILDDIGKANRLLINPPLLGAFRGVEGIESELNRIARTNSRLDEIEQLIRQHAVQELDWQT